MSAATDTKPSALGAKLATKQPIDRVVTVFLDGEAVDLLRKAEEAKAVIDLQVASERLKVLTDWASKGQVGDVQVVLDAFDADAAKRCAATAQAVREAEQACRDSSVDVHFRSIGRLAYSELEREHPPTEEDHAKVPEGSKAPWHFDTWAPALVAASSELTEAEVAQIWDAWNQQEIDELFAAALQVNNARRVAELGKARG